MQILLRPATALLLLLLAPIVPAGGTAAQDAPPRRPNVLLLFADDQRADSIGAHGNPYARTPSLDALTARGTSFRRAYCMGSPHGAVCVPSRAMLHTGRSYHGLDLSDFAGCRTLGECLREVGYRTHAIGKWHNGRGAFTRSFETGREVMFGGMSDHNAVPVVDLAEGEFTEKRTGASHSSTLFADAAVEFLEGYDGDAPYFCYVAFTAPHDPRDPPEPYRSRFYDVRPPLPANFMPQHPFDNGFLVLRDENLAGWPREREIVSDQIAEYHALIAHLDHEVGRVLAALAERDDAEDTLVVYAADHGLAVGSHGLLGKQSVYEHSLRAPLIVAGPGVPEGASTTALVYLLDLYPTLLARAGARPDVEGVLGRDLAPLWRGERASLRESVLLSMGKTQRAVVEGRWKYARYPRVDHDQLFDLASDPHELVDLSDRPEHAERVARMRAELAAWQARADDGLPLEVDEPRPLVRDLTGTARKPDRWQPAWIRDKYFDPPADDPDRGR